MNWRTKRRNSDGSSPQAVKVGCSRRMRLLAPEHFQGGLCCYSPCWPPRKENCIALDFAGNVRRHRPINLVRPKRPSEGGEAPTKVCPERDSILAPSASECPDCGYAFPAREVKIAPAAPAPRH